MKKVFNIKLLLAICLLSCTALVSAQESFIEHYNLPIYDCKGRGIQNLEKIKLVIALPDDSTDISAMALWMEQYYKGKGIDISLKTESRLSEDDYNNGLWILGPLDRFHHWEKFSLPVRKLRNGFKIGEVEFTDLLHSFSYMSDSLEAPFRIVASGNSFEAYKQISNMYSPGLEFVILKDVVPQYIGNASNLADLDAIRREHYTPLESKYYTFMLSKKLNAEQLDNCDERIKNYNDHAEAFVKKMELELPKSKILTYIHADQQEIKYICGFFDALCDGTVYGFVTGEEIHSWGFGDSVEHEANHNLFNQQINKRAPTFLSEGIQKWYEYFNNPEYKEQGRLKALEFIDEDLTDIILGKERFFQGDKYYLISGIVVDYLIETYGLDKFKEVFGYETAQMLPGFENTYGKSLPLILEDYKKWLVK